MSGAPQQPQLRIHAATSASSNVTAEQDPTGLFEQMAQLFQLTPLPKRRPSMMSPSVVAIDALLDDIGDPQRLLHEMVVAAQTAQAIASPEQAQHEQVQPQAKKKQRTGKTVASVLNDDEDQPPQAAKKVRAPRKKAASSTAPTVLARLRKTRGGGSSADIKDVEQQQAAATAAAASAHLGSDSDELSMDSCSPSSNSKSNGTVNAMRTGSGEVMVNASRARQKEETAHLRVKVHELQAQLLKLGNRSKVSACRVATTSTSANNSNNKQQVKPVTQVKTSRLGSLRAPIWERIANSAKDRKRRSEVENLRLRETVETQAKLSKSLEKILMKRANLAVLDMPPPPPLPASCPASHKRLRASGSATEDAMSAITAPQECSGDDDARVFDELSSQLDRQYASLDDVHRETGLDQRTAEWQRCEVVESNNSASDLLLVDCCDIKLYPFSMDAVHQATWRCATVTAIKDVNYVSEVVLQTESTAHTKTTITIRKPNTPELVLSVKSVIKRITEPHRRVFLLNSVTSVNCRLIQLGAGWVPSPASVEIRDQGWATVESISDDERWPGSILRVCMRARPVDSQQMKHSGLADLVEGEVKASGTLALSNLLVDTRNQVMRARQQIVENFLLEAEIAQRS